MLNDKKKRPCVRCGNWVLEKEYPISKKTGKAMQYCADCRKKMQKHRDDRKAREIAKRESEEAHWKNPTDNIPWPATKGI